MSKQMNKSLTKNLTLNIKANFNNFQLSIKQSINNHGIIGVFGHSGSGKSTLLRAIAGLETRVTGELTLNNRCLLNTNRNVFIKAEQRNIGLVFQNSRLFPHLTVNENLLFAQQRCSNSQLNINDIIKLTTLTALLNKKPAQLSGGEQQRVALARAILAEPELLLLDEPLSALDQANKIKLLSLLTKVQQTLNIPIYYVSHSLAELQQVADDLLVLSKGKVLHYGNIHQVIHQLNQQDSNSSLIHQQTSLALAILAHDDQHGLTELALNTTKNAQSQQSIYLPLLEQEHHPLGSQLRCFIFANDISITLEEPSASSIVNHLSGSIVDISQQGDHSILLTISCAEQPFFAQISLWSFKKLVLKQHMAVFIQFKASAVRTLGNNSHFIEE
jgi:molybdate transport system ATP-binding protein